MKNSGNPMGTNVINNLTVLKVFSIATAIQKNLCLASCSSHLFPERKELLEVPSNYYTTCMKAKKQYLLCLYLEGWPPCVFIWRQIGYKTGCS